MAKHAEVSLGITYLVDLFQLKLSVCRQRNLVVHVSSVVLFL